MFGTFVCLLLAISSQESRAAEEKKKSEAVQGLDEPEIKKSVAGVEVILPSGQKVFIRDLAARLCDAFNVFYAKDSTFEKNERGNFEWPLTDSTYSFDVVRIFAAAMVHVGALQSVELDAMLSRYSIDVLFNVYRFANYIGADDLILQIMRLVPALCLEKADCCHSMSRIINEQEYDIYDRDAVQFVVDSCPDLFVSKAQTLKLNEKTKAIMGSVAPNGNMVAVVCASTSHYIINEKEVPVFENFVHIFTREGYNRWKQGATIKMKEENVVSAMFNHDTTMIALIGDKGSLNIVQLKHGKWHEIQVIRSKDSISSFTWNLKDPTKFAIGHASGLISIWAISLESKLFKKIHHVYAINDKIRELQWNEELLVAITRKHLLTWRHQLSKWKLMESAFVEPILEGPVFHDIALSSKNTLNVFGVVGFNVHGIISQWHEDRWANLSTYKNETYGLSAWNDDGTMLVITNRDRIEFIKENVQSKYHNIGSIIDSYDYYAPWRNISWHNETIASVREEFGICRTWCMLDVSKLSAAQFWLLLIFKRLHATEEGRKIMRGELKCINAVLTKFPAHVREFIHGEYLSDLKLTA
jgi:hypothetical protein